VHSQANQVVPFRTSRLQAERGCLKTTAGQAQRQGKDFMNLPFGRICLGRFF
jgi:hypothetical protein